MRDEIVARVLFTDGIWREVYQQPNGRQYVLDQDAEPLYGVWFLPRVDDLPEPIVVQMRGRA